jgi:hypothetical protein
MCGTNGENRGDFPQNRVLKRVARPWGHWYKGRAAIQVDVDVRAIAG